MRLGGGRRRVVIDEDAHTVRRHPCCFVHAFTRVLCRTPYVVFCVGSFRFDGDLCLTNGHAGGPASRPDTLRARFRAIVKRPPITGQLRTNFTFSIGKTHVASGDSHARHEMTRCTEHATRTAANTCERKRCDPIDGEGAGGGK